MNEASSLEGLTAEEQFAIASFKLQANSMSREQAIEMCIKLFTQLKVRERLYEDLIRKEWGLD